MNFSITFLIIGLAALAAGGWYMGPILCGRGKAQIAEWAAVIPSLHEVNWIKLADTTAFITMLVGIFVLVPAWFEPLRQASGAATSGLAVLLAIQVIFLSYACRSPWVTDGTMPPDRQVVLAEYGGAWPGRSGGGGMADIYADDGEWFNVPSTVKIIRWMMIPK